MNLSDNLTLAEATKSNTAIRHGINNVPTGEHLENLIETAINIFQPIRDHFSVPIKVTSGYRSEALNDRIGGSKTSQHSKGQALDLDADVFGGVTNQEIFEYVRDHMEFDQMIHEFGTEENPAWVHISYRSDGENRGQILRAYKDANNRTKYKPWR